MKTSIKGSIKIERIHGDPRMVRLIDDFWFYSAVLRRWCRIPNGFVYDEESVPGLRGSNPEAGAIHDYLCRIDSDPVVSKQTAASVYGEFQDFFDEQESGNWLNRAWDWLCRGVKTSIVRVWIGYYHKFTVMATYEEQTA